jgi:hypothetical protein
MMMKSGDTPGPSGGTGIRRAYLGLGSNLGDRAAHLQFALDGLADRAGPVAAV